MSDQVVRLENWEVSVNPWKMTRYLHGEVHGHPRHPDGRIITTSAVIELRADVATTKSGTIYHLGKHRVRSVNATIVPRYS